MVQRRFIASKGCERGDAASEDGDREDGDGGGNGAAGSGFFDDGLEHPGFDFNQAA